MRDSLIGMTAVHVRPRATTSPLGNREAASAARGSHLKVKRRSRGAAARVRTSASQQLVASIVRRQSAHAYSPLRNPDRPARKTREIGGSAYSSGAPGRAERPARPPGGRLAACPVCFARLFLVGVWFYVFVFRVAACRRYQRVEARPGRLVRSADRSIRRQNLATSA